ncbi:hypothetical protein WJ86_25655 [Burkholderia multivorans]|nr:hypothetical protein WJ86_25655 [Burkholderia multivorans]
MAVCSATRSASKPSAASARPRRPAAARPISAVCSAARRASRPSAASARPRDSYRWAAQWRSARRLDRQVSRAQHRRGRAGRRLRDSYTLAKPKLPRLSIPRERVDAFAFAYVTEIAPLACEPHIDACSKSESPR